MSKIYKYNTLNEVLNAASQNSSNNMTDWNSDDVIIYADENNSYWYVKVWDKSIASFTYNAYSYCFEYENGRYDDQHQYYRNDYQTTLRTDATTLYEYKDDLTPDPTPFSTVFNSGGKDITTFKNQLKQASIDFSSGISNIGSSKSSAIAYWEV